MNLSDRRRALNKKRRTRQLRRNIALGISAMSLSLILSVTFGSILSNAQSDHAEVSYKYYKSIIVQRGETLWTIADNYIDGHHSDKESYIREVRQINSLSEEEHINTGQYLIVPYYSSDFVG